MNLWASSDSRAAEPVEPSEATQPLEQPALPAQPGPPTGGLEPSPSPWPDRLVVEACPFAAPSLPQQTETALNATLLVKTPRGIGSAVFISPDGFALTAAHVVGPSDELRLVGHGGHELRGRVVRVDESQDVALLKVEISGTSPCLTPIDEPAPIGSDVFVLGSPAGEELSFSVAKGIVSGYREFEGSRFVQLDAALNPGNSGGPALNSEGGIVGIVSWKVSDVSMEGLSFAVPADVALQALGVEFGPSSSSEWASMIGRNEASNPSREEPATAAPTTDPSLLRRRRIRRGLVVAGAMTAGVGLATIIGTAAAHSARDRRTKVGWSALVATNTVGWSLAGGGAAMLVAGLLIRKKPKADRPELSLLPTPQGLLLQGRF